MKILHVLETAFSKTETFVYNYIISSHAEGKNEVMIICDKIEKHIGFELPKGIIVFEIGITTQFPSFIFKWINNFKWRRETQKTLKFFNPDIVHCHFGTTGIRFAKNFNQTKFITSFYGYDVGKLPFVDRQYNSELKKLWLESTLILGEGPYMLKKLNELGCPSHKLRLNPILINNKRTKIQGIEKNEIVFLLIGRFVEKKGFHFFLEGIGKIQSELPPFKIKIIGDGIWKERYIQIIEKYNLIDCVEFLGSLNPLECHAQMEVSSALVQPSMYAQDGDSEGGAPTVILESQAVGLPIICSNHADIPHIMGYDDFIFNERNETDMQNSIKKFIATIDFSKTIELGIDHVNKNHSVFVSRDYLNILRSI